MEPDSPQTTIAEVAQRQLMQQTLDDQYRNDVRDRLRYFNTTLAKLSQQYDAVSLKEHGFEVCTLKVNDEFHWIIDGNKKPVYRLNPERKSHDFAAADALGIPKDVLIAADLDHTALHNATSYGNGCAMMLNGSNKTVAANAIIKESKKALADLGLLEARTSVDLQDFRQHIQAIQAMSELYLQRTATLKEQEQPSFPN